MSIDVVDLRAFYSQRLGTVARHFVGLAPLVDYLCAALDLEF